MCAPKSQISNFPILRYASFSMTLAQKVRGTIERHGLLITGDTVLVACSGGADSVALLSVVKELASEFGISVRAAHLNHQLRGSESDADQAHVEGLCRNLGIPLDCENLDLHQFQAQGNLENAGRRARYDSLARIALPFGAVVATGHTLNDQAETFLMKLFRGAGPGGLSGIAVQRIHHDRTNHRKAKVIRPLLGCTRSEVLEYLGERGLEFRTDRTNRDTRFDRNWIRHELIPLLERRFNPRLVEVLGRTSTLFHELDDLLERTTLSRLGDRLEDPSDVRLPISLLSDLPDPLRRSAVRMAYRRVRGTLTDLTQRHVASSLELIEATSGKRVDLPGGVVAQREFEDLRIGPPPTDLRFSYRIDWPGEQVIPEVGKKVRVSAPDQEAQGWLALPEGSLIIRNRRPGDRYQVTWRSPEKSLKRIFMEHRIPVSRRGRLLIFEAAGRIVWVEGFPPPGGNSPHRTSARLCAIEIETFRAT